MTRLDVRTMKVSWPVQALIVAALGLGAFTYFRGDHEDETPPPVPTKTVAPATPVHTDTVETSAIDEPPGIDIFPVQTWQPPPPPPPPEPPKPLKPVKAPPPEPPPLPFAVRTLWLDQQGVFYVVLSGTGREFPLCMNCHKKGFLHQGDVILNAYRIEHISRNEVRFVYLPLKRGQTLSLGELK